MAGHNGRCLANLYVVDKATGPEFTPEDQEVIGVLAVQAAAAPVNSAPICSMEGEVESVVIVIQDMSPLNETDRMRADFLSLVGHELRTPLTSIKGSLAALADTIANSGSDESHQLMRILDRQTEAMRNHLIRSTSSWLSETDREREENKLAIAICQGIVNAHGGRLWIQPGQSDQGLTLGFSIPAAEFIQSNRWRVRALRGLATFPRLILHRIPANISPKRRSCSCRGSRMQLEQ